MAIAAGRKRLPIGIALIITAFFFSALMGFIGKGTEHVPISMTVFLQYAVSFVLFSPVAFRHGIKGLATSRGPLMVVRSLSAACAQLLFFRSLASLPLLDASLLSNSSPLFIPLIVLAWLHKPIHKIIWLSLGVGLLGVVLVIHPSMQIFRDSGSFVALASGFLSAVGLVTTNKLAESEPPSRILFYNFGIATLALAPYAAITWKPLSAHELLLSLAIGLCFAATQFCIIIAYRYASAATLSPFNYSVVIFSGLLGWLFLGNVPSIGAILGTMLIIAGGILSIERGHREGFGHAVGNGHWTLRNLGGRFAPRRRAER